MAFRISRRGVADGVVAALPTHLGIAPFGFIFGVAAAEIGLALDEAMAMTVIVVAGASQLAALQLMAEQTPAALVILTGAVINLRMAMYSASIAAEWRGAPLWTRLLAAYCLHDQAFALSMRRYAARPDEAVERRVGFFFGVGVATILTWLIASYLGFRLGAAAPTDWSLDFAAPLVFIAVVAPMLRSAAHSLAAVAGASASLLLMGLPFGLGVVLGGAIGILAGARFEAWMARERAGRAA